MHLHVWNPASPKENNENKMQWQAPASRSLILSRNGKQELNENAMRKNPSIGEGRQLSPKEEKYIHYILTTSDVMTNEKRTRVVMASDTVCS
ncbi:hypothetical protein TNCT_318651 [Trichonephila clavata]|uniref:Uncharacterized protein n=1 Tax=Trichonephila clavata TaxID=2740835 RepID=A0A8X6JLL8_TRICU|nr:hypothetical protein TNCT_239501 [Trichonephila clavata]GFR30338.1 hypothetical protein TNCT_318651 [Trichonephila clavata]